MKANNSITILGLFALFASLGSCGPDAPPEEDFETTPYEFELKAHFANQEQSDNTPQDNPTTVEGAELGRYLFYDKRLSKNNTISCASCHRQENAFSDPRQFSVGFEGEETPRHSMTVVNMRWQPRFFWDIRAATLEEQVLLPIQDHIEMGLTLEEMANKLTDIELYPPLFENAFDDSKVTSENVAKALSQFVRSIVSQNSKFDKVYGLPDARVKEIFTDEEYLGYKLFFTHVDPDFGTGKNLPGSATRGANCGDCHSGTFMTDNRITNNGLDSIYNDKGYGNVSEREKWQATFKTPTLRNIELTAPYMHDGRFETLMEVVEHYDAHVVEHKNLDPEISEAGNYFPGQLNLTEEEKEALVAFMKTLTDYELISNPAYANPFD